LTAQVCVAALFAEKNQPVVQIADFGIGGSGEYTVDIFFRKKNRSDGSIATKTCKLLICCLP
jgi:hypothetical protein